MTALTEPTTAPIEPDEDQSWRFVTTTIASSLHILVNEPVVEFGAKTYPSLTIRERKYGNASFALSLTGSAEHRRAFTRQLRAVAEAIDAWTDA